MPSARLLWIRLQRCEVVTLGNRSEEHDVTRACPEHLQNVVPRPCTALLGSKSSVPDW